MTGEELRQRVLGEVVEAAEPGPTLGALVKRIWRRPGAAQERAVDYALQALRRQGLIECHRRRWWRATDKGRGVRRPVRAIYLVARYRLIREPTLHDAPDPVAAAREYLGPDGGGAALENEPEEWLEIEWEDGLRETVRA